MSEREREEQRAWAAARQRACVDALKAVAPGMSATLARGAPIGACAATQRALVDVGGRTIAIGPAGAAMEDDDLALLGWEPPAALAAIWVFAAGIGPDDGPRARWWADCLWPYDRLVPLVRRVRFGEENILYDSADYAIVIPDAEGGGWCVRRGDPAAWLWPWRARDHALGERVALGVGLDALARRW